MAIHPKYADAIFAGQKLVELRKRAIASDVSSVLVYATSPVRRIVGEFGVAAVIATSPQALWPRVQHIAGLSKSDFDAYYSGSDRAAGIMIASATRFAVAVALDEVEPALPVPQSFMYLSEEAVARIYRLQVGRHGLLDRIAQGIRAAISSARDHLPPRVLATPRRQEIATTRKPMDSGSGAASATPTTARTAAR